MSDVQAAVVQTLVAEVRVLMVGSRQITLSVAKQLDRIPLSRLEAFGRIRVGGEGELAIGRDSADGSLAVARYAARRLLPVISSADLSKPLFYCPGGSVIPHQRQITVAYRARRIDIDQNCWTAAACGHRPMLSERCDADWEPNGNEGAIDAVLAKLDAEWALHKAASRLPLIVLAGLR